MGVGRNLAWFWVVAALVVSGCGASSSEIDDLQGEADRLNAESEATSSTTAGSSVATVKNPTTSSPATTSTSTVAGDESGVVVSITDGDTIRVVLDGVEEPLRLIGINAPEGGECLADQATGRLRELVDGKTVGLELDVSDRDQFDRLLRYVYVGGVFVNEILVAEGFALARRYEPDTAHAEALELAQGRAEAAQLGMWAPAACGTASTAALAFGMIRYDADGNDNNNLNDEWVEITNSGTVAVDMTGWVLKDESASHRFNFPASYRIGARGTVRIYTGCGTDTAQELYWCNTGSAIWNNSGDTAFLLDPSGNIIDSKGY